MNEKLYTARWYSKEIEKTSAEEKTKELAHSLTKVLTEVIGDDKKEEPPKPEVPPSKPGLKLDWYPKAIRYPERMKTKGKYAKGYPVGAVVHFTAGRDGAAKTIAGGIRNGFAFVCIQKDGRMVQAHPVSEWGYHAGESAAISSKMKQLVFGSVSDELIGIEINCAGRVEKMPDGRYKTWFDTYLSEDQVRYTPGKDNQLKGYYEKYTPEQEAALIEFLLWLKSQAPEIFDFDFVVGHDECAGPKGIGRWRKNDPGAALSMTMTELRDLLKAEWAKRT